MKRAIAITTLATVLAFTPKADAAPKRPPKQVTGVLNLNQATAQQLDLLPGVGAKAAARIIDFRKKTPFTRTEELVKVKGFGKKKYDRLKAHLAVAGPTTLQPLGGSEKREKTLPSEQGRAAPPVR